LRNDYLQKTTLAGFWAANMCTLAASSPNVSAYLAGDWSQGGIAEWFALTTQSQNNPYLFYPIAQTQLQNVIGPGVGGATGARLAELGWGSGFASWCGAGDSTTSNDSAEAGAAAALQECSNNGGTVDQCSAVYETYLSSKVAISPGDTCTQSDGTPGVIKTPGSTIKSTLDKVLGSQQDKLVQMGNIGPEINLILGNIATVMQTVMLASNILGGSESDGLLGFGNTSSTGSPSPLSRFQNTQGYMGVGSGQVYQGAANLPSSGSDMLGRVDQYRTAWNTITSAANTASTSVSSLASHCLEQQKIASTTLSGMSYITGGSFLSGTSQMSRVTLVKFIAASGAQAIDAQTALTNLVAPVLARAATAASVITAAQAMVQKIQGELSSGADTAGSAYAADMQTLQTMPPSATDVATIEQESQAFEIASANPDGSLNVSGGSLVDQMNLLNGNAITLKATVCNPNSTLYTGMSLFGG